MKFFRKNSGRNREDWSIAYSQFTASFLQSMSLTNQNYPKAWSRFITQTHEPENQLPTELADSFWKLARWSARFRLAKSFKALDLGDAYASSDTPQLYSAITRIFLVYSSDQKWTIFQNSKILPGEKNKLKRILSLRWF